ncbi:MAG: hypothetical protein AAGK78_06750, partial [Planctomycetota bacterium]
ARRQLTRLEAERRSLLASAPSTRPESVEQLIASALQEADKDSGLETLLVSQIERLQTGRERIVDLERQVASLEEEIAKLEGLVAGVGRTETELRRVERNLTVKRIVHEKLMERAEMARVTGALGKFEAPERIKVIDQPTAPSRPEGFSFVVFAIAGLVGGFGAGVGAVVVLELLEATVKRRAELEDMLGAPVIARLPVALLERPEAAPAGRTPRWRDRLFPGAKRAFVKSRARVAAWMAARRQQKGAPA